MCGGQRKAHKESYDGKPERKKTISEAMPRDGLIRCRKI